MRNLLLILLLAVGMIAEAQTVRTTTADTLQGSETVTFAALVSSSSQGVLSYQALCTELGGTSDGTLFLQGSVDGISYHSITETAGKFHFYPNDTLTITDGAVIEVNIYDSPDKYYRWKGVGTTGDTTLITPKWIIKD